MNTSLLQAGIGEDSAAFYQGPIAHLMVLAHFVQKTTRQKLSQGPASDRSPLIGRIRRGDEAKLIALPEPQQHAMRDYIGSVAASRDGQRLAFSAPRGGVIVVTDTHGRPVETFALRAGCGIVAVDDSFLATSGDGSIARLDESRPPVATDLHWDHHVARVL